MTIDSNTSHHKKGFTLIEVLIAIFIFSMVITIVFAGFKEISYSANIVNKSGSVYEMIQGAMAIMKRDFESVYVTPKRAFVQVEFNDEPEPYRFQGQSDFSGSETFPMIRFTTLNHLPVNRDPRHGVAEVVYYMDETDEYGYVLRRSDRIIFHEPFKKMGIHPTLLRHVKSFTVKYIDETGEEHDNWDSDSDDSEYGTPSSIAIRVDIEDDDRTLPFETRIMIPCVRKKTD